LLGAYLIALRVTRYAVVPRQQGLEPFRFFASEFCPV
jgi:hypothetical protein